MVSTILLFAFMAAALAAGNVSVSGKTILRDGRPWVARGVTVVGLVAPANAMVGRYVAAREHFGQAELDAIQRYGADLIRFQVSQPGLDPQMPIYSPAYISEIDRAVGMARRMGFTVILSMQAQKPSGMRGLPRMPTDSTQRAWKALAPRYGNDTGVMYELFNEPVLKKPTPRNWARWAETMQPLVDTVRASGARNVLVLDGLHSAKILVGAPALRDPLHQIIYAVHPYPIDGYNTPQQWQEFFGQFAETHPVIATEWNMTAIANCYANTPQMAQEVLAFLQARNIGVVGWAFDRPDTLTKDFNWNATDFNSFRCGGRGKGAGQLLKEHFAR